jgi:hypothetical protein
VSAKPPPSSLGIDPKLEASDRRLLVENRDSAYFRELEGVVARLTRSNGLLTDDVIKLLKADLTDRAFGHWMLSFERLLRERR